MEELSKLDALLRLRMLEHRETPDPNGPDMFRGLYITEEEVQKISLEKPGTQTTDDPSTAKKRKTRIAEIGKHREILSKKIQRSLEQGIHLPFHRLASIFHLHPFEWDTLLICLAPQLDLKYEKLYAYLQDDVTKKHPSVDLILDLLCGRGPEERIEARGCFFDQSPLLKYQLIAFTGDQNNPPGPSLSRCLTIDDSIARFLLGFNTVDSRLASFAGEINPKREWASLVLDNKLKTQLKNLGDGYFDNDDHQRDNRKQRVVFYLKGPRGAGKKSIAEAFCHYLGLLLFVVDTPDLILLYGELPGENSFDKILGRLFRETLLHSAAVYFDRFDHLIAHQNDPKEGIYQKKIIRAVEEFSFLTFLAGEEEWHSPGGGIFDGHLFIKIDLPVPSYEQRKCLWEQSLNRQISLDPAVDIDAAANKFNFTPGQIRDAVKEAGNLALVRELQKNNNPAAPIKIEDLYRGCHSQSNRKLSQTARKIDPKYTWTDIVLPHDKLRQLKEVCSHVKYRQTVYSKWGFGAKFSLGKGLNILFSGTSGTGKTMSAEIIAHSLGLELYKIDLSNVVSKYIGETEKNLSRIFKEAETANCILFFDEADALFGKRSEVKDAHDRYANIEINYLLQKMEEHEGVVILATNFLKNIDDAFKRRIHFSVDFPFPDEIYRLKIWQKIFPPQTPKSEDVDFEFLARKFKLSGGNIKNIALNAAFLAAEDSPRVEMAHAVWATRRELQKMGRHCSPSDFGKYYDLIASTAAEGGQRE